MTAASLFLSHGSPMMILEDTPARRFIAGLGPNLGKPAAVVVASAHWLTPAPRVGGDPHPAKINDMSGFPAQLYRMTYQPAGAPALAERIVALLGDTAAVDPGRGIDHGIWSVMSLIWPDADIPVVPLSIQSDRSPRHHYEMGRRLASLAADGVLVIGSGAATHNLADYFHRAGDPATGQASRDFTDWLAQATQDGDIDALLDYRARAPAAIRAHPTDEHLLPFFVALGAAAGGRGERVHASLDGGSLAMDCYAFRLPESA